MDAARQTTLRADGLRVPKPGRLPSDDDEARACLAAHELALDAETPGYADPATGLFVMTAEYLRERGYCCDRGCRHCPYEDRK